MGILDFLKKRKENKTINEVLGFINEDINELKEKSEDNIWEEEPSDIVYILYEKLLNKLKNFNDFTESEKIFYLCKAFSDEAESSGDFNSVYCTDICNYVKDIVNHFKTIGASEISEIVNDINNLFDEDVLLVQNKREDFLLDCDEEFSERLDEYFEKYSEYNEQLEELLYNYAIENKDKFNI